MHVPTSDLRIHATKPLIAPVSREAELPLSDAGAAQIAQARRDIATIITGADDWLFVVVARGLPVATEFLDTTLGQYYADLVSWGAIGARTVESQVHRELASGLSLPVGFKNRTDGDVQVAVDVIRSARHPRWFPSLTREGAPALMGTTGNEHTHLVLRGGKRGPNFSSPDVRAAALLTPNGLSLQLMVDCSQRAAERMRRVNRLWPRISPRKLPPAKAQFPP